MCSAGLGTHLQAKFNTDLKILFVTFVIPGVQPQLDFHSLFFIKQNVTHKTIVTLKAKYLNITLLLITVFHYIFQLFQFMQPC
jgi:hypothetical protein